MLKQIFVKSSSDDVNLEFDGFSIKLNITPPFSGTNLSCFLTLCKNGIRPIYVFSQFENQIDAVKLIRKNFIKNLELETPEKALIFEHYEKNLYQVFYDWRTKEEKFIEPITNENFKKLTNLEFSED